ncbi:ABC transporter substrate-binding protein [Wenjunlia tyrosinilytica]|uniref:Sugar ABC transporter substrate-binding protein n=1 Tax=Wenjunlia tyrosinilytica TaxID=1544741 RepID=A0A917ZDA1_9ACTN|nr:sugar ABC transporter substrate-binding protein [Wenjunlia tyrosinilytica]GGO80377.1 sugar ABC transporter substrate-binding protein [Wenjunlia tyrosinilytica]
MRRTWTRKLWTAATATALVAGAAACGGGSATSSAGGNGSPKTLTYWASNQGAGLEADKAILTPELKKFEKRTGIKVKLEVVPWSDLLNRILAATTSGQGPDVLNIGNTWSASLQATGALLPFDDKVMERIGGKDRFVANALAAAGAEGRPPAAVPLYSLAYGLYYNKKLFKEAGIDAPPATWDELVADGKKLTGHGRWGLAVEGASYTENVHHAFVLGQQQGARPFTPEGRPAFDSPQQVTAVKDFVDLMAKDRIVNPGNAEYANQQSVTDFARGKAAMLMWQAATSSLKKQGMDAADYGIAPVPLPAKTPPGGKQVTSMVAGINLAVFKNTDNRDGALKFVKFMTGKDEQRILNKTYGSMPPVTDAYGDPAFETPELKTLRKVLADSAAPLPQVPQESQYETLVGNAVKKLFADAASGHPVTESSVKAELTKAKQQMPGGKG